MKLEISGVNIARVAGFDSLETWKNMKEGLRPSMIKENKSDAVRNQNPHCCLRQETTDVDLPLRQSHVSNNS